MRNVTQPEKLDDSLSAELKRQGVPGASIAVVREGKLIRAQGYGLANVEHQIPAKAETIYQSGSVGKQFTAALVLRLVEDGKVKLDDPIGKYLPQVSRSWANITVRHLLTHTSGLGDPYNKLDLRKDYTDNALLKIEGSLPLLFKPGEKWSYSNMGYHVLGFLCNKVGGRFYGDQLRDKIFKPAGMETARIISEADIIPNRAAGYERIKGELKNQSWVSPALNTTADGSLYLSVFDMVKWDLALTEGKILTPASRKAMWTPVTLNNGRSHPYGFGWALSPVNNHKCISHGGAWQGFRTGIYRFVEDKLTVIALANASTANPDKLCRLIAGHYIPELAPVVAAPIEDKEPEVTKLLSSVLTDGGKREDSKFTTEFLKLLPLSAYQEGANYLKSLGSLKMLVLLKRASEENTRRYVYRGSYEGATLTISLVLTKNNKIAGLGINPD
ncbi:serine hydrolase domain-containing protein [Armatimonas sp.]|uniref:serine hydrolase domain-containing protein n=1 Tax=Armatimonas sp. TaxID=1872638 RepID=UPI00286A194D|nr:serine hydrolase domain-containing protein [Armatimonas sp.]